MVDLPSRPPQSPRRNSSQLLTDLLRSTDFIEVTLACEDIEPPRAHKMENIVNIAGGNPEGRSKYYLNDIETEKKLKEGARRTKHLDVVPVPFKGGECTNIIFSTGAYIAVALPLLKDWTDCQAKLIDSTYTDGMVVRVVKVRPKLDMGGLLEGYQVKMVANGKNVTIHMFDTVLKMTIQGGPESLAYTNRALIPYLKDKISRRFQEIQNLNSKVLLTDSVGRTRSGKDSPAARVSQADESPPERSMDDGLVSLEFLEEGSLPARSKDEGLSSLQFSEEGSPSARAKDDDVGSLQSQEEVSPLVRSKDNGLGSLQSLEKVPPPARSKNDGLESLQFQEEGPPQLRSEGEAMCSVISQEEESLSERAEDVVSVFLEASPRSGKAFQCAKCKVKVESITNLEKHMFDAHKSKQIILNEDDSLDESSDEEDTTNFYDTANKSDDADESSDEEDTTNTNDTANNYNDSATTTPPPALWADHVPELPVNWDFSGGSLPSSFLEKALEGVARKIRISPKSSTTIPSKTSTNATTQTSPVNAPLEAECEDGDECLMFLGRQRFIGEMKSQGVRLERIEQNGQEMQNMMKAFQLKLDEVANKLRVEAPAPKPRQEPMEAGSHLNAVANTASSTPPSPAPARSAPLASAPARPAAPAPARPAPPAPTPARPAPPAPARPTPAPRTGAVPRSSAPDSAAAAAGAAGSAATAGAAAARPAPAPVRQRKGRTQTEWFSCNECAYEARSLKRLDNHVATHHTRPLHSYKADTFLLIGDSHLGALRKDVRSLEKALGKGATLVTPGLTNPKEDRAYCSTPDWPGAWHPENSQLVITQELLGERPYRGLIILAPTNDISNLEKVKSHEQNNLAARSAHNTVRLAEDAIRSSTTLETVLIMEQPARVDNLAELSSYSATKLKEAVAKSEFSDRIKIGSNCSDKVTTEEKKQDIFGAPSKKNDGVHMRGKSGPQFLTATIEKAIRTAGMADRDSRLAGRMPAAEGLDVDGDQSAGWRTVGRGGRTAASEEVQEQPRTWAEVSARSVFNQGN